MECFSLRILCLLSAIRATSTVKTREQWEIRKIIGNIDGNLLASATLGTNFWSNALHNTSFIKNRTIETLH